MKNKDYLNLDKDFKKTEINTDKNSISLLGEKNFLNIDGIYYGADQNWFYEKKLKKSACSTVAAANVSCYMANHFEKMKNLYPYNEMDKKTFIRHMYDVEKFISPSVFGMPSMKKFSKSFEKFATSRGINLKANWSEKKLSADSFVEYIKAGLKKDLPVLYLQILNLEYGDCDYHWMTITKYFENEKGRFIAVSTWGEKKIFDFDRLWKWNLACGVLYFEPSSS